MIRPKGWLYESTLLSLSPCLQLLLFEFIFKKISRINSALTFSHLEFSKKLNASAKK